MLAKLASGPSEVGGKVYWRPATLRDSGKHYDMVYKTDI